MIIPIPIVTNNTNSALNQPLPDWLNIILYVLFNIVLIGIFGFLTWFIIDMVKDNEKGMAILFGLMFYPFIIGLMLILSFMFFGII